MEKINMKKDKFVMNREFLEQSDKNFRNEEFYKKEFAPLIESLGKK